MRRSGRFFVTTAPFGVRGNIWMYDVGKNKTSADDIFNPKTGHPSVMPEAMAEDHILAWSKVNDLVLDIFAGSGTSLKMAALNQRKFLGFDISAEYWSASPAPPQEVQGIDGAGFQSRTGRLGVLQPREQDENVRPPFRVHCSFPFGSGPRCSR